MDVRRLVILVEGDSELILMKKWVIPALYQALAVIGVDSPWSFESCKITTNRSLNKKGGNISYRYLLNDIRKFAAQGCTLITTFLDFFRLPTDFPGYTTDKNRIGELEVSLCETLRNDVENMPFFLPYVQLHEFEALLFSDIRGFELILDEEDKLSDIQDIIDHYPNPEDINGGRDTAPSKRLLKIYDYDKTGDSEIILGSIGLQAICDKCPRFSAWFDDLQKRIIGLS